jgi:hypothetical protein
MFAAVIPPRLGPEAVAIETDLVPVAVGLVSL